MSDMENNTVEDKHCDVLPTPSISRWKKRILIGVVAAGLVVSGMIIGGGSIVMRMRRSHFATAMPPQSIGRELYGVVNWHAKLDEVQKEELRSAIDARIQVMERIRENSNNEIRKEFEGMRDDVAKLLRPDDAAEWNKKINRYLEKFAPERRKR